MPQYRETESYLKTFANLNAGWHFGEGVPPSRIDIGIVGALLSNARDLGFKRFDVFPGVDGEIQLAIYNQNSLYSITLEVNGTYTIFQERDDKEVFFAENLSYHDVVGKLEDFAYNQLWNLLELSISSTSQPRMEERAIWHSGNQKTEPAIPALRFSVPLQRVDRSVPTSRRSILISAAIQSSTGRSQSFPTVMQPSGGKTMALSMTHAITT